MNNTAVRVEHLSKLYRLGATQVPYKTLRETIMNFGRKILKPKVNDSEALWALKDVSFEVNRGEVMGIIGRNGAGKSTLLKILSRITEPTEGSFKIHGRVSSLLEVGTGFHPELTGRENIFLNGAILGMKKKEIESKFDEIVAFAEVERFIDTPLKHYSSGMYLRLAFAVAAHLEPEILIVDEVLAVGDAEFQKKCMGKMKNMSGQGRTVLFVSHSMPVVKRLCTSGILLEKGRLKTRGDIHNVIDEYFLDNKEVALTEGIIPDNFYRPYVGTAEAKIRAVYVTNMDNKKIKEIRFDESFKVVLEFEVVQDIKGAVLGLMIQNSGYETIIFSSDYKNEFIPRDYHQGKHRMEVEFNTRLMPQRFTISVFIAYFNTGEIIDMVEGIYEFIVNPLGAVSKGDYPWQMVHGYVHASTKWYHESLS